MKSRHGIHQANPPINQVGTMSRLECFERCQRCVVSCTHMDVVCVRVCKHVCAFMCFCLKPCQGRSLFSVRDRENVLSSGWLQKDPWAKLRQAAPHATVLGISVASQRGATFHVQIYWAFCPAQLLSSRHLHLVPYSHGVNMTCWDFASSEPKKVIFQLDVAQGI